MGSCHWKVKRTSLGSQPHLTCQGKHYDQPPQPPRIHSEALPCVIPCKSWPRYPLGLWGHGSLCCYTGRFQPQVVTLKAFSSGCSTTAQSQKVAKQRLRTQLIKPEWELLGEKSFITQGWSMTLRETMYRAEIKPQLTWKLLPTCWLASAVSEGTIQAAGGEKPSMILHSTKSCML